MPDRSKSLLLTVLQIVVAGAFAQGSWPVVPVGLDAYRHWDQWAQHRTGTRAYMRSTYDRAGGNESADASHFLYQEREDFNVTLDVEGTGILYFVRTNHWHGSPWHYEVDGRDTIVQETSTADPLNPVEGSVFMPESLFPNPLTWTWSTTRGADLNWVPIPFEKKLRLAYSRTRYGTGYYIWHEYVPGTPLSQPIKSWDAKTPPTRDVLELLNRAGTDIVPRPGTPEGDAAGIVQQDGELSELPASQAVTLARLETGPTTLRAFEITVPRDEATSFSNARLRITWDDRTTASIDAPVALFFGAGVLYNRDNREYLVKSFPMTIRYTSDTVHLACYFPMPYQRSAQIELVGAPGTVTRGIKWSLRHQPYRGPSAHVGYFHATYRDHANPPMGHDLVLLDTRDAEGTRDWHGHFVGTSWIFSHNANLGTLEGDPRFFFDDSGSPQAYGTGTEEWGGGGDYWGGRNMTLPFAGHPNGAPSLKDAKAPEDKIQSAYRFLLADLMPFGRRALIRLEHGAVNDSPEHYETVTYWYGSPGASLVRTDEVDIGDEVSERQHAYASPDASIPYALWSRYELGVDHLHGREVFPQHQAKGRVTTGTSEFTVKLDPENVGAVLRRKLDYSFANQRAEVYVADASSGTPVNWKPAGVWYLAGSNTCVYSDPKGELDPSDPVVQTSNRRFRDDEFLLGREHTEGRTAIRVRLKFAPVDHPLLPGFPPPTSAWSELRYFVDCYVKQVRVN